MNSLIATAGNAGVVVLKTVGQAAVETAKATAVTTAALLATCFVLVAIDKAAAKINRRKAANSRAKNADADGSTPTPKPRRTVKVKVNGHEPEMATV